MRLRLSAHHLITVGETNFQAEYTEILSYQKEYNLWGNKFQYGKEIKRRND